MVAVLKAKDIRKLFNYLEGKITSNDLKQLRKVAPGFWDKYSKDNVEWRKHELSDSVRIVFLIETIVDAKLKEFPRTGPHQVKDRHIMDLSYSDGMPKHYLMEIAEILGIEGFEYSHRYRDCNTNRFELADKIMKVLIGPSEDMWNIYFTRKYPTEKGWKWRRYRCLLCKKKGKDKIIPFNTRLVHLEANHIEEYKVTDDTDQFFEMVKE
jgi:hypothetical protein